MLVYMLPEHTILTHHLTSSVKLDYRAFHTLGWHEQYEGTLRFSSVFCFFFSSRLSAWPQSASIVFSLGGISGAVNRCSVDTEMFPAPPPTKWWVPNLRWTISPTPSHHIKCNASELLGQNILWMRNLSMATGINANVFSDVLKLCLSSRLEIFKAVFY